MLLGRRSFLLASATALVSLSNRSAWATVARALELEELVRSSERALVATALEARSSWAYVAGRKRIVTDTRVRLDRHLGGPNDGAEVMVRTLGGQVGDVGQVVHGEALLRIGEPALLFLTPDSRGQLGVTGMAQGHFPIRPGADGTPRLAPSPQLPELFGPDDSAVRRLAGKSTEEAARLVQRTWRDAR